MGSSITYQHRRQLPVSAGVIFTRQVYADMYLQACRANRDLQIGQLSQTDRHRRIPFGLQPMIDLPASSQLISALAELVHEVR